MLYLKATMKLWQQQSEKIRTHKGMSAILDKGEVKFLQGLVQAIEVLAKCCADIWNKGVEEEIGENIKRYQGWEGAGDVGTSNEPYKYVETIDQAFYANYAKGGSVKKQAWDDGKQGGSPKKIGGDGRSLMSTKRKTLSWLGDGIPLGQSTG